MSKKIIIGSSESIIKKERVFYGGQELFPEPDGRILIPKLKKKTKLNEQERRFVREVEEDYVRESRQIEALYKEVIAGILRGDRDVNHKVKEYLKAEKEHFLTLEKWQNHNETN